MHDRPAPSTPPTKANGDTRGHPPGGKSWPCAGGAGAAAPVRPGVARRAAPIFRCSRQAPMDPILTKSVWTLKGFSRAALILPPVLRNTPEQSSEPCPAAPVIVTMRSSKTAGFLFDASIATPLLPNTPGCRSTQRSSSCELHLLPAE